MLLNPIRFGELALRMFRRFKELLPATDWESSFSSPTRMNSERSPIAGISPQSTWMNSVSESSTFMMAGMISAVSMNSAGMER